MSEKKNWHTPVLVCLVVLVVLVGAALRLVRLERIFSTEDDVSVALRVLQNPGYAWMLDEFYGVVVPMLAKIGAGTASALGRPVTEFWWRFPIALFGTVHLAVNHFFARRQGFDAAGAAIMLAVMCVLPIHVQHSRYAYGHEIAGLFCLTLAVWSLIAFFERPDWTRALVASGLWSLYLSSHHYIVPFFAAVPAIPLLARGSDDKPPLVRVREGMLALFKKLVWVGPIVSYPIWESGLRHTKGKDPSLGLYLESHIVYFFEVVGIPVALAILVLTIVGLRDKTRRVVVAAYTYCGLVYMAPLVFGAPAWKTNVYCYMLLGTWFLVFGSLYALQGVFKRWPILVVSATALVFGFSLVSNLILVDFVRPGPPYNFLSLPGRIGAAAPDTGMKTAGYLIRTHAPRATVVSAYVDGGVESVCDYYLGRGARGLNWQSSGDKALNELSRHLRGADIVLAQSTQLDVLRRDARFRQTVVITEGDTPCMWIFSRSHVSFPVDRADVGVYNELYDQRYAPRLPP